MLFIAISQSRWCSLDIPRLWPPLPPRLVFYHLYTSMPVVYRYFVGDGQIYLDWTSMLDKFRYWCPRSSHPYRHVCYLVICRRRCVALQSFSPGRGHKLWRCTEGACCHCIAIHRCGTKHSGIDRLMMSQSDGATLLLSAVYFHNPSQVCWRADVVQIPLHARNTVARTAPDIAHKEGYTIIGAMVLEAEDHTRKFCGVVLSKICISMPTTHKALHSKFVLLFSTIFTRWMIRHRASDRPAKSCRWLKQALQIQSIKHSE